ncbi:MAG TPA: Yip1 family protein [Steroidobacteraceae bacterium]|nr:Yip1 family protein [Steroidobacteraceae bacterium]
MSAAAAYPGTSGPAFAGGAAAAGAALDSLAKSGLVARIKGILLSPRSEWPVVAGEQTGAAALITGYVLPLAAVAALLSFLRMTVIGVRVPFGDAIRVPLTAGLMQAVLTCVMAVVGVGLVALVINLLAPTFGGTRDIRHALQVAAYSLTAAFLGSLLSLLPLGTLLYLLAGVYGIYTLYLGLPVVMRSKPESAAGYTATVVVCTILAGVILGAAFVTLGITGRAGSGAFGAAFTGATSREAVQQAQQQQAANSVGNAIGGILGTDAKGKSDIGNAINNLAQAGRQVDQHHQATGNTSGAPDAADTQQAMGAAGGLLSALGHSLGGEHRHDPVDFHTLEGLLPSSLSGMQRGAPKGEANGAMGLKTTSAEVDFAGDGNARVNVSIKDASAISGLAGLAEMVNSQQSEQGGSYEKSETLSGQNVHEKWDAATRHGELSLIVAKRFGVDVSGDSVDMDVLKNTLAQVDFGKLQSMKDANPAAQ